MCVRQTCYSSLTRPFTHSHTDGDDSDDDAGNEDWGADDDDDDDDDF